MAKNRVKVNGRFVNGAATDPAVPASGDPILLGQIPGVAITAEDANGNATFDTDGVYNLSVKAVTTAGAGSAVAIGDILYYVPGNTPKVSKAVGDAGAVRFGYALGAITSGATATIAVKVGY